jgi:hypothetical protein
MASRCCWPNHPAAETRSNRNGSKVLRTLAKDSSEDCRIWICKYYDLKQIQFMDTTGLEPMVSAQPSDEMLSEVRG